MAQSKLVRVNGEIAKKVVGTFERIEGTVVGGYTRVEDAFVGRYLIREGETVEETKARLKAERMERDG